MSRVVFPYGFPFSLDGGRGRDPQTRGYTDLPKPAKRGNVTPTPILTSVRLRSSQRVEDLDERGERRVKLGLC